MESRFLGPKIIVPKRLKNRPHVLRSEVSHFREGTSQVLLSKERRILNGDRELLIG